MSETPRVDAEQEQLGDDLFVVGADFARQLERELAEAYERAAKVCDEMAARVLSKQDGEPSHPVNVNLRMVALMLPDCADAIRALIAK